jgi:hypothetical protein
MGNPYPSLRVRVLVGRGRGTKKPPKGYPRHTLAVQQTVKGEAPFFSFVKQS